MNFKNLIIVFIAVSATSFLFGYQKKLKEPKSLKANGVSINCVTEDTSSSGVGDVKYSILSEAEFQNVNGDEWVLLKGQTETELGLVGEDHVFNYINNTDNFDVTKLPDARGVFLRGRNNARSDGMHNPDGELKIGQSFNDGIRNIYGQIYTGFRNGSRVRTWGGTGPLTHINSSDPVEYSGSGGASASSTGIIFDASRTVPVANDNRPKNIIINTFVRVKPSCIDPQIIAIRDALDELKVSYDNFVTSNVCDSCLNQPESNLSELQAKSSCFKTEIDDFENDLRNWSVSCQSRTIGNSKRVLMAIGAGNRSADEQAFLEHLDNQYPYYNVIETNLNQ